MGWFALIVGVSLVLFWWIRRQNRETDNRRLAQWLGEMESGTAPRIRATDRMRFGPVVPKVEQLLSLIHI